MKHSDFINSPFRLIAVPRGEPFVTPNDWRVAAQCAHDRNRKAVRARVAGNYRAAQDHQSYANWLIARARMWRNEWESAE